MNRKTKRFAALTGFCGLAMLAGPAMATLSISVPEPSILSLLGIGIVIGLVIAINKRRK